MIGGKKVLAIIPARGGSKGLHRKNIRPLLGRPLISWSIEEARKSKYIDRLILSSEDPEIIMLARGFGCEVPFVRPGTLSGDDVPAVDVVLHAMKTLPEIYDYIMMLQPTTPMRTTEDINGCLETCAKHNAPACVTVTEASKNPYWMYTIAENNLLSPIIAQETPIGCRQLLPKAYSLNGAVYVGESDFLRQNRTFLCFETTAYVMPPERSIDIDTKFDFGMCEYLMTRNLCLENLTIVNFKE